MCMYNYLFSFHYCLVVVEQKEEKKKLKETPGFIFLKTNLNVLEARISLLFFSLLLSKTENLEAHITT